LIVVALKGTNSSRLKMVDSSMLIDLSIQQHLRDQSILASDPNLQRSEKDTKHKTHNQLSNSI
jgi:hypothetical protein